MYGQAAVEEGRALSRRHFVWIHFITTSTFKPLIHPLVISCLRNWCFLYILKVDEYFFAKLIMIVIVISTGKRANLLLHNMSIAYAFESYF